MKSVMRPGLARVLVRPKAFDGAQTGCGTRFLEDDQAEIFAGQFANFIHLHRNTKNTGTLMRYWQVGDGEAS